MADASDRELLQTENCNDICLSTMTTENDFQRLQNAISNSLTKCNDKTNDVENFVKRLGTPVESEPLREYYLQLQISSLRLQNETITLLGQINFDLEQLKEISLANEANKRKRQTSIETLRKQYIAAVNRFQEAQRISARKGKESLNHVRAVSYYQHNNHDSQFTDNGASSNVAYKKQVVDMQALTESDDEQLRELERDVTQLSELCKDIGALLGEREAELQPSTAEHQSNKALSSIRNWSNKALTLIENPSDSEQYIVPAHQKRTHVAIYQFSDRVRKLTLIILVILVLFIVLFFL